MFTSDLYRQRGREVDIHIYIYIYAIMCTHTHKHRGLQTSDGEPNMTIYTAVPQLVSYSGL